jgi:hypothetical protein
MIKTNQNMKENPPISFHIDQVQLQAFQTHLVDSKSFFFNDELSFIVRNNSPFYASIFDLMIQINGYQNIDEFRILSFNFSHSDSIGSNFQNTTSFTDFKIKMILLIELFQSSFQDFTFKKIEISLDINQKIFFKHSRIANFKAQTDLLLDELSTKDYLTNLEKALRIKPVEVSKMTFVTKSVRKRRSKLIPNRINFIDTNK